MKLKTYSGPYRVSPQTPLDFSGKLTVDLFAGGGGASTGIEWALGKSPDIAVNHDRRAVAMHRVNHPHTRHFCESVFKVVPQEVCAGRPVGDLWMSPDCTHHSKARGSKPVSKRVRGLAWVGKRWAATVRPERIYLENVEELQQWGPLVRVNGEWKPCKKRAGRTFRNFVRELRRLGYQVDWRELRACDFGAPTIRKRLFLIARCDGQPIIWPEATHAEPKAAAARGLEPWRTAAECIDWSIPCPSIFNRKKPLAENTLRRVAKGIKRYVIDPPEPFIVPLTHHGKRSNHSLREPLKTVTAAHRGELALVVPSLTEHANGSRQRTFPADEPLHTITTKQRFGLVMVRGELYEIVDIGMRMLRPRELYRAQGFADSYIIEYGMDVCEKTGIPFAVKFTLTEQVRFCGNSVSPYCAAAIVAANAGTDWNWMKVAA